MEPDKVLRFAIVAVILLFLIGALIIGTRMMNPRVDATEGVKKLTELGDANVQKIDAKIQELEQTEADEAAAWKAKSAKGKRWMAALCLATVLHLASDRMTS